MPSSDSQQRPKFYLTTPIYYVNGRPHIGHAYTNIVADVLARRERLLGKDVLFLTGTDEHGQKIERSAAAAGIAPQQFADQVSAEFRTLWDRMGLTYNRYIRTTDRAHKQGVQQLFRTLYERGWIYLSTYTGSYCVSDEAFVDQPAGTPCPDCGRLLETLTEENFFFKLSAFQQPLLDLIESHQLRITPETARNEVLSFIRGGLKDLSVSRSSFTWGIPVPEEIQKAAGATQPHIVYVWLDALANYITAIGYGSQTAEAQADFARYWPADLHLVGKEITRFHCVYWPAFLLAADLPTPQQITANGWLLFDNAKMSKSKGNVVRTETILDAFGDHVYGEQFPDSTKHERDLFAADVLRYFLLREIPFGQDGSFSFDAMVTRYNADLANGYGNLVSRVLNMVSQNFRSNPSQNVVNADAFWPTLHSDEEMPSASKAEGVNVLLAGATEFLDELMTSHQLNRFCEEAVRLVTQTDSYITTRAPWKLAKAGSSEAHRELSVVLYTAGERIRILTLLLHPILPYATAQVWRQLGLGDIHEARATSNEPRFSLSWGGLQPGTPLGPLSPIFPRADKALTQVMIDMEDNRNLSSDLNNSRLTSEQNAPATSLKAASTPAPAARVVSSRSDPAAAPSTTALDEPTGTLPVGGSGAQQPALPTTPGPHTQAPASGVFAPSAASAEAPDSSQAITIDDFLKVDLRVAKVLVAERIPKADKLLRLEVDLGTEKRQILSGIAQHYTPEELLGRRIVVVANLAPRKMRGLDSHGMLLAASEGPDGKPILATFGEEIALGSRVR